MLKKEHMSCRIHYDFVNTHWDDDGEQGKKQINKMKLNNNEHVNIGMRKRRSVYLQIVYSIKVTDTKNHRRKITLLILNWFNESYHRIIVYSSVER